MKYQIYDEMRTDPLDYLSEILGLELGSLSSEALCELLLLATPFEQYSLQTNPGSNNIISFINEKGWNELIKILAAHRLFFVLRQLSCFEF